MAQATDLDRDQFYATLRQLNLPPLWERLHQLLPKQPTVKSRPFAVTYETIRPLLLEAARLVPEHEAERRVLILENPHLPNSSAATETLYAGLQIIMPGEIARAHKHTPAALRFIIEGSGAYTSVNGEKAFMEAGDLILTPSMTWHDHGHLGQGPTVWLDVLDIPIVRNIGPAYAIPYASETFPECAPPGDSNYRFGAGMIPLGWRPETRSSPIFHFPYKQTRLALEKLRQTSPTDPCHGLKMEYVNPTTGGATMPTISIFLQLLTAGFKGAAYRTTEGSIYCIREGRARVFIGEHDEIQIDAKTNDVFVIPCWHPHRFEADNDAVIFSASDKVIQQALGFWQEQRPT